jgi:hypothetical protein
MILGSTLVTILPWILYAYIRWPDVMAQESTHALRHMTEDIEQWAGPWHRVIFDYWARVFWLYYPAILAAVVFAIVRAKQLGNGKVILVLLWAGGVLAPNLVAQSKTMTATLIGWPAMWLLLGYMISRAIRGDGWAMGTWLVAMMAAILIRSGDMPAEQSDITVFKTFTQVLSEQAWIVWQPAVALLLGLSLQIKNPHPRGARIVVGVATALTVFLAVRWFSGEPKGYALLAVKVTQIPGDKPDFKSLGVSVREQLPANAVLLVDEKTKLENKLIQFYSNRSSYPINAQQLVPFAKAVVDAGGRPYLVTPSSDMDFTEVIHDAPTSRFVYELISAPTSRPADVLAAAVGR